MRAARGCLVADLQKCTKYEGLSEGEELVQRFWRVLASFTEQEKSLFLKFVWGRSRLPLTESQFTQQFKLTRLSHSRPDVALPVAHTCFFQLDIPSYTAESVCCPDGRCYVLASSTSVCCVSWVQTFRDKLLYAIHNCSAIDGDNTSVAQRAAGMADVQDDEDE